MKGFIIYPTCRVIDNRAYVCLFGRLENGENFLTMNYFKPYFYIKEKDLKEAQKIESFETQKTDFKTFNNEPTIKIIKDIPKEIPPLRSSLEENNIETFEADIRFPYRFMIDNNIQGSIEIEGDYKSEENIDRIYEEPTIKPSTHYPKLKVLSLDIETNQDASELYCISLTQDKTITLIQSEKTFPNVISCKTEEELLEKFRENLLDLDPDIITGWNLIDFDLKILQNKFKEHKIPFILGRDNFPCRIKIESNFFRNSKADFPGRIVVDALSLLRTSFIKVDDYKLNTVASQLLNDKKLISFEDKGKELETLYFNNPKKLIEYNQKDTQLVLKILEKTKVLELSIKRSLLTGMPVDRVSASIASLDSLYLKKTRERKLVAPTSQFKYKEKDITGGYVQDSTPGIYNYIIILDFKSLYPSIIRTFNIDPSSFIEKSKSKNVIKAPNGAYFKTTTGILPLIIEEIWQHREKARKNKDELTRYALKILMNCFSPDTDLLTGEGIKNIEEIQEGDKVYSINPKNNKISLYPVTKKFHYYHKGKMYRIKSKVLDYLVTPNHRFLIDFGKGYQWKTAEQLFINKKDFWLPPHSSLSGKFIKEIDLVNFCKKHKISYRIKQNKLQNGPKHSSIENKFDIKDWLNLLGWFIAEGYIYINKPKKYKGKISWKGISKRVIFYPKTKEKKEIIKSLLERMNLKFITQKDGFVVCNHILAEVLENEVGIGSHSKRIPEWVFELDSSLLLCLFDSLMQGDGDKKGERYSTCNKKLAYDFLRLIHHVGLYGFVYENISKYKGNSYEMYKVQINKNKGLRPYIIPKRNMKIENYEGSVLCIEVKPHHTVLAGRKTKLHFCGQSFFGVMASPNCRFFNLKIANAITHFAQQTIKLTSQKIKEHGYDVIYSDTDSLFIVSKANSLEEANRIGKKLQIEINEFYKDYIQKEYNRKSYLELEYEKCFIKFLMPRIRHSDIGAKKRYAGLLIKNNKEKLEFVGLEAIRSDWTDLSKEFQLELYNKIFHDKNVFPFINKFVKDLNSGKYDNMLIYKKSLRKPVEQYIATTPPHIKAIRKLPSFEGKIIEYVITEDGPEHISSIKHKIDYKHYIDKQLKPIADSILSFFDKSFDEILQGSKQTNLFSFKQKS